MASILVVDDDADIRTLIEHRLSRRGHAVSTAASGEHALVVAAECGPFDVAVLDVMLPGMSGLVLAPMLREQCGDCRLPVVFISALTGLPDVEAGQALGASYLPKPFSGAILADFIEQACITPSAVAKPSAAVRSPGAVLLGGRVLVRTHFPLMASGALAPLTTGWLSRYGGERACLNASLDQNAVLRCWTLLFLAKGRGEHDVYVGSDLEALVAQMNARIDLLAARGFRVADGERPQPVTCEQALRVFGLAVTADEPNRESDGDLEAGWVSRWR